MAVDKPAGADTAHAPAQPGKWRLGGALWLLGMPGVVVVWALLPTLKVNEALLPLPLEAVLLLSGLQTAVLLALAVALGVWLAPRVGLRAPAVFSWVAGQPAGPALRAQLVPGLWGGVAGAAWLWLLSRLAPAAARARAAPQWVGGYCGAVQRRIVCCGAFARCAGDGRGVDHAGGGVCPGGQYGLWLVGGRAVCAPRPGGRDHCPCPRASAGIPLL